MLRSVFLWVQRMKPPAPFSTMNDFAVFLAIVIPAILISAWVAGFFDDSQ